MENELELVNEQQLNVEVTARYKNDYLQINDDTDSCIILTNAQILKLRWFLNQLEIPQKS